MDRRTFLAGSTLVGVAGVAGWAGAREAGSAASLTHGTLLRDLPELVSSDTVEYTLTIANTTLQVGEVTAHLDTYNGQLPGPVLRVRPGDTLRVLLRNGMVPTGLPRNGMLPVCAHTTQGGPDSAVDCITSVVPDMAAGETMPQKMVRTNLHTHGFQVSPSGISDNVFLTVDPGEEQRYGYRIPEDHPAGLHWYHPHHHGSTAHQGWHGLAGPIVVEGDIDQVPEVAAAKERILVINELWVDENGNVPSAVVLPIAGPVPFTTLPARQLRPEGMLFPINGQMLPEITIAPGEVQRWRVLNAGPHRQLWWHIEGHQMHQIGQDGVPFYEPKAIDAVMLSPANRAEFLIKGGAPGRYRIFAPAYDQGHPGGAQPQIELGTLVVTGEPQDGKLPTKLVDPPTMPDLPVSQRRTFTMKMEMAGQGLGVLGLINGESFDHERIDAQVEPGTVEEWTFKNDDVMQHPMHIHVNPFQVVDVQGIPRAIRRGRPILRSGGTRSGYHPRDSSRCVRTSDPMRRGRRSSTVTSCPMRTTE